MTYLYKLKFASQEEAEAILSTLTDYKVEGIVTIGTITKPAQYDEAGAVIKEAEVVEGWHIDLLAHELIQELVPYCLDHMPAQPVHGDGWAGNSYILVTNTN